MRTTAPFIIPGPWLTATLAAAAALAAAGFIAHPAEEAAAPALGDSLPIRLMAKDENDVVIKTEDLPKSVRDYIAKEMPDAKITEARKDYKGNKEKKGDNFTYEVDVKQGSKEYELRFGSDGKFMKKRENAGDEPDEKPAEKK